MWCGVCVLCIQLGSYDSSMHTSAHTRSAIRVRAVLSFRSQKCLLCVYALLIIIIFHREYSFLLSI